MRNIRIGSRLLGLFLGGTLLAGCAGANPDYVMMTGSTTDGGGPGPGGSNDLGTNAAQCGLVSQKGCALGQKCTTHDTVTTVCDPNGNVNRGSRCKTTNMVDNCYAGTACADAGGGIGICRAFCNSDSDCGPRSYCQLPLGTSGLRMCTESCNPIGIGAGCAPGMGCYVSDYEHTDCNLPGTASERQSCIKSSDCQVGLACLGAAGAGKCLYICASGMDSDCPFPESCYPIQNANGSYWTTYGGCS